MEEFHKVELALLHGDGFADQLHLLRELNMLGKSGRLLRPDDGVDQVVHEQGKLGIGEPLEPIGSSPSSLEVPFITV